MKNRASRLDARVDKVAAGFTIIETILFIAIAGLVFTGVIAGTNGAIRRQRYKDAVQSFTDDVRNLYSMAENTEVLSYGDQNVECGWDSAESKWSSTSSNIGRGRSNCSVYGIIAKIRMKPTDSNAGDNIEAYWLIGKDQREVEKEGTYTTDGDFLKAAHVSPWVSIGGEETMIEAQKSGLFWGSELAIPCSYNEGVLDGDFDTYFSLSPIASIYPECSGTASDKIIKPNDSLSIFLLIYRSPISNIIRTRIKVLELGSTATNEDYYESKDKTVEFAYDLYGFDKKPIAFCVTAGDGMSYSGGYRMVSIKSNAASSLDVRLVEADSEENVCNK